MRGDHGFRALAARVGSGCDVVVRRHLDGDPSPCRCDELDTGDLPGARRSSRWPLHRAADRCGHDRMGSERSCICGRSVAVSDARGAPGAGRAQRRRANDAQTRERLGRGNAAVRHDGLNDHGQADWRIQHIHRTDRSDVARDHGTSRHRFVHRLRLHQHERSWGQCGPCRAAITAVAMFGPKAPEW